MPVVVEVNTPYVLAWDIYDKLYFKRYAKKVERYVIDTADIVVTVSTALKELLVDQGVDAEKIMVTPNAINPDHLASVQRGVVRQQYGLNDRVVIGFVGSLRRWHGIDLLMNAIPRVLSHDKQCHFLIVGTGELEGELRSQMRNMGMQDRVTFAGRVPHDRVLDFVDAMDVGLMPNSNFYGSPMKVFEYMAMKKATIAPRLGPLEEVITHGWSGWLTVPGDEDSLVEAIGRLASDSDLRRDLGENACRHVLANHTWQTNAQRVVDRVNSLLNGPSQSLTLEHEKKEV